MKIENALTVRIKICGITNTEDAVAAAEFGADAIGFVFAPSPRQISPEKAREIIEALPPLVLTVGVFVDEDPEVVASIAAFCHLDLLQFHGKESAAYCRRFGQRVIKAVRVQNQDRLERCSEYSSVVDALLLDTYAPDRCGGTGLTFDWHLALEAKRYGRIILAGGLNPDNVAAAIGVAKPYAVDASSGLEKKPGVKDHEKIARFIQTVRHVGR
ncbi:MAG: phosphoribosylanthranilate isomerase [Deltaproteobacteria bacterium]|nr:phosphoribosylanthranilate isomerase [Deltaproteobacteria bacterium]MBW2019806.1 phosphoribosylanthranilate isomerase [Deltaproteobacteria bacterium]MBW2074611.1 phosphoribosylanthranilate isomerase [Deltaproteobacteria bacterium]